MTGTGGQRSWQRESAASCKSMGQQLSFPLKCEKLSKQLEMQQFSFLFVLKEYFESILSVLNQNLLFCYLI